MKKILVVIGIVVLFVGASVIPSVISVKTQRLPGVVMQNIWYVDDDGMDYPNPDFNNIQDAVNASSANDEIRVYKGNYPENVVVNKKLDLIGGWNGTSTIDGGGSGNVVKITAPSVNVENFTIINSGNYEGVSVFDAGVHVLSSLNTITGNNISDNNGDGIYLSNAAGNEISGNVITNNAYVGIDLFSIISGGNTVSENTIQDNGIDGIYMLRGHGNFIQKNNIIGNKNGIHLRRSRFNLIEKNYIADSSEYGLYFELFCLANSITGNNITGNTDQGIFLKFQCDFNTIFMNNFIENDGTKSIFYTPHVGFISCFLNAWRENYWDDYAPIIPNWWYLIWGRWGFIPWPNFDLYPSPNPYPWPPT